MTAARHRPEYLPEDWRIAAYRLAVAAGLAVGLAG